MAIIKCKMCGGDLILTEGQTVAECEYCGSRQTVPKADDEKKLLLFDRAERLRKNCEGLHTYAPHLFLSVTISFCTDWCRLVLSSLKGKRLSAPASSMSSAIRT